MGELSREIIEQAVDQINRLSVGIDDAALHVKRHPNTVLRRIKTGELPAFRVAQATRIWIRDLDGFK